MAKAFASQADLADKTITFARLSDNAYAYTAEGDPNSGVVIGDDGVMVVDAQATPAMAADVIRHIRTVTDKPIKYVVLSHYHAVRVLGASAYQAGEIIASQATYEMIKERGKEDMASEIGRFPRLFRGAEAIRGLTWPTLTFDRELTLWMGKLEVRLIHVGAGHTRGDTIVWLPSQKVLFSGDLVEYNAGIYTGDAHLRDWPDTLEKLRALAARTAGARARTGAHDRRRLDQGDRVHPELRARPLRQREPRAWRRARASSRCTRTPAGNSIPSTASTRSTSTACPSTCRARSTRRAGSRTRASGPPSGTRRCGNPSSSSGARAAATPRRVESDCGAGHNPAAAGTPRP